MERAAKAAKLVIDMPEYDLYKEYLDDGSIDALMSCINLFLTTPTNNKELYWLIPERQTGFMSTIYYLAVPVGQDVSVLRRM